MDFHELSEKKMRKRSKRDLRWCWSEDTHTEREIGGVGETNMNNVVENRILFQCFEGGETFHSCLSR